MPKRRARSSLTWRPAAGLTYEAFGGFVGAEWKGPSNAKIARDRTGEIRKIVADWQSPDGFPYRVRVNIGSRSVHFTSELRVKMRVKSSPGAT